MNGWIKLHRQMLNWEWYLDPNVKVLFLHFLLIANYEDKRWRGHELKAGSLVTGIEKLSNETGLSIQMVRTALKKLQSTKEVTVKPSNKGHIILLNNFKKYNDTLTDNKPEAQQKTIPSFDEFERYALQKKPDIDTSLLVCEYQAWSNNGWRDDENETIKNWKALLHSKLQYLSTVGTKPSRNKSTTFNY